MKNIDIKKKSQELYDIISKYEKKSFIGFFSFLIRQQNLEIFDNLFESKLKDFQYLIGLRLFNKKKGIEEFLPSRDLLKDLAYRIKDIKDSYFQNDFLINNFIFDLKYQEKLLIHEFTFNNYFHNGTLSYVEQDIDLFERTFIKLEKNLMHDFGLDITFLIDVYKYSEETVRLKGNEQMKFTWEEEYLEIKTKAKQDNTILNNYINNLPKEINKKFLNFISKPIYEFLKFNKTEYYSKFPTQKIDKFLELFACNESGKSSYIFYTDKNQLDEKPIIQLSQNEYLFVYQKQLPVAYYNFFYRFYSQNLNKEKMQKIRGKILEEKCFEILKDFFKKEKKTYFYQNYYIDNNEQDILVLSNGAAFIIETKANSFREPFRDIEKSYIKIRDDFKANIQKGYEQCERVRKKFLKGDTFEIYDSRGKLITTINPNKYYDVFNIIVTQERLGPIQQNLGYLLNKNINERYPFSIYINDLEIFFRTLRLKTRNPRYEFVTFLKKRELLHERLFSSDELDICATYLSNKDLFLKLAEDLNATITMCPDNQNYFDELYFQGIGLLKNELNIEEKKQKMKKYDNGKIKAFKYEDFL